MTTQLAKDFPATTMALGEMREAVRSACRNGGCSETGAEQWVIAINEACINIIQHAYCFADNQHFHIDIQTEGDRLITVISDNGTPVKLSDLHPRELDDLRPGGLGVRFIRELTDTIDYLPSNADWHNRLQLSKRIR